MTWLLFVGQGRAQGGRQKEMGHFVALVSHFFRRFCRSWSPFGHFCCGPLCRLLFFLRPDGLLLCSWWSVCLVPYFPERSCGFVTEKASLLLFGDLPFPCF